MGSAPAVVRAFWGTTGTTAAGGGEVDGGAAAGQAAGGTGVGDAAAGGAADGASLPGFVPHTGQTIACREIGWPQAAHGCSRGF